MIVSFSGAQSTGKTTLLKHLQEKNKDNKTFTFVEEVTRLVKRVYSKEINEGGNDVTQSLIMYHHFINSIHRSTSEGQEHVKILDRCAVDGFVYTLWLRYNRPELVSDSVLNDCYETFRNLLPRYSIIFYTSPEDVVLIDDGERSTNDKFRDDIIALFNFMREELHKHTSPKWVVLKGTVQERLKTIKEEIEKYGIEIAI